MSDIQKQGPNSPVAPLPSSATVPPGETYSIAMLENLRQTRPWVLFMAIMAVVGCGFLVIAGILFAVLGSLFSEALFDTTPFGGATGAVLEVVYIALAGLYVPMIVFLFRYAGSIKNLLATGKTQFLELALRYQKSYWKYVGIMAIVAISAAIVFSIVTIAFAMSRFAG